MTRGQGIPHKGNENFKVQCPLRRFLFQEDAIKFLACHSN